MTGFVAANNVHLCVADGTSVPRSVALVATLVGSTMMFLNLQADIGTALTERM
jgi:hypothetical protein